MDLASEAIALKHIIKHIPSPRPSEGHTSPLFVGIQGSQGIGKTTLTAQLASTLSREPYSFLVATLSLDDLYLGHEELKEVGRANPKNSLLQGRGYAGTHDFPLGTQTLKELSQINLRDDTKDVKTVLIPSYDKSLYDGQGDRLPKSEWRRVEGGVDIVILEGWSLGFYPVSDKVIQDRWTNRMELGWPSTFELENGIDGIREINEKLKNYASGWYHYLLCFIQISPPETSGFGIIYKWRLEQEHWMKKYNGGKGMTDEQVKRFVDRYIPGYIFFGEGPTQGTGNIDGHYEKPPWTGNGVRIVVDEERRPVRTDNF